MRDMGWWTLTSRCFVCSARMILGEDNEKMSKSRGNEVNPDEYVSTLGVDSVRAFLMFIGPRN